MELTLSTHLLVYHVLDAEALAALAATPFSGLELWLAEPHLPWRDPGARRSFRAALEAHGLRARSTHLPFYPSVPELMEHGSRWSLIAEDAEERAIALAGAREGLRASAELGAESAVLHLGWPGDDWEPPAPSRARQALRDLLPLARELGIRLLLENILSLGTRSARLVALLEELDPEGEAGLCLDLGHAHIEGREGEGVLGESKAALPRLQHLHVHDNDGRKDRHHAPGTGELPYDAILAWLHEVGYQGTAALELRDYERGTTSPEKVLATHLPALRAFADRADRACPAP